ncbi:integrase arm-type DNA-binding domain-containing protein [Acinetobacter bereziniae]|uniref:tyrosine-type recombinase/integrase n=1 Tax=Acinetobacter bereziniae TaxID=106648 RepID=UPI0021CE71BD|nr:integrase arm-type DNA-binding domain-containing protein [Acinetobacter bereziniae]MCU4435231.1 integrase arm-type DNA-binding domain-containing protein [Acinetobacter bereziniae]
MLSDTKIKSLKPTDKIYRVIDSLGLYIEVRPNGRKYWRYRYQWQKNTTMVGIGEYPMVQLAEARKKRDEAKALLLSGKNPAQEKKANTHVEVTATTFKDIAEEYKNEYLKSKSERYVNQFDTSMNKDVYKVIGDKDIKEVSSADILTIMKNTIKRIKKQKNFGTGEVTAIQNRKFIGAVMRYAITSLRAEYDPTLAVVGAVQRPDVEHARPLTKEEAKNLRSKLENYRGSTTVKNAGLTMLYSMLRTIEIRRMQWDFVDFEARTITFPIASKRTGQARTTKKNRIHIVPMSDQIFKILQEQYVVTGNQEYVFSSVYKTGMIASTTLNRMLEYIGLGEVTAHDFRATASTLLNEKGYDEDWIEKQLAHADDNKTRASYNHARYLEERRNMLQDWADIVDSWNDIK